MIGAISGDVIGSVHEGLGELYPVNSARLVPKK